MFNAYLFFLFRSFLKFTAVRILRYTYKKLERTTHTLYILWQWCGKHRHGVGKVLAKGRATSETQQGEIDRSVHTSLYHPARLPLCPAHFGVATNYIASPKNWSPNNRRSSVYKRRGTSENFAKFFQWRLGELHFC